MSSHNKKSHLSLDEMWKDLEKGIIQIYKRENKILKPQYIGLYTYVYNYCTSVNQTSSSSRPAGRSSQPYNSSGSSGGGGSGGGAQLVGFELYKRLRSFLEEHLKELLERSKNLVKEDVLKFYTEEWEGYRFSSKVLNNVCRYLNLHWAKRERDEGRKDIHEVYQLALLTWKTFMFEKLNKQVSFFLYGNGVSINVFVQLSRSRVIALYRIHFLIDLEVDFLFVLCRIWNNLQEFHVEVDRV